jgi:hypothetical protein
MDILDSWWAIIRDGLYHVHPIQFVIIGLLFGFMTGSIVSAIFGAVFAAVIYIAVDALWPVIVDHKPFVMPAIDTPFWHFFLSLSLAFLVVTLTIYILKSIVESIRG